MTSISGRADSSTCSGSSIAYRRRVCTAVARELADDIISDADLLIGELQRIKDFAQRQLAKLPAPLRE
jgi:hypothetical protein